jgi:phospholipid transport system transporter-binding protein
VTLPSALALPTTATLAETPALVQRLEAALAELPAGVPLRVDASTLSAFDSSAIALLLHARRLAQAAGRGIEVHGVPPQLTQLARLYGVDALIGSSSSAGAPA